MSKVAVLADVHGNLQALRAVLEDVAEAEADTLCVAGDVVGYGANPRECVELLQSVGAHVVLGNHESYTLQAAREGRRMLETGLFSRPVSAGIRHTLAELSPEQHDWLGSLPLVSHITADVVFAHATLHAPEDWEYLLNIRDAHPTFEVMESRGLGLAFFGHTHLRAWFPDTKANQQPEPMAEGRLHLPVGSRCAVTAGSVGQPRGGDGQQPASWVLWDTEARLVEFKATDYDAKQAARAIIEADLPMESAARLLGHPARSASDYHDWFRTLVDTV